MALLPPVPAIFIFFGGGNQSPSFVAVLIGVSIVLTMLRVRGRRRGPYGRGPGGGGPGTRGGGPRPGDAPTQWDIRKSEPTPEAAPEAAPDVAGEEQNPPSDP
jgi:hypothetical protein